MEESTLKRRRSSEGLTSLSLASEKLLAASEATIYLMASIVNTSLQGVVLSSDTMSVNNLSNHDAFVLKLATGFDALLGEVRRLSDKNDELERRISRFETQVSPVLSISSSSL